MLAASWPHPADAHIPSAGTEGGPGSGVVGADTTGPVDVGTVASSAWNSADGSSTSDGAIASAAATPATAPAAATAEGSAAGAAGI